MQNFEAYFGTLVHQAVHLEGFAEILDAHKVNPEHWPQSRARSIMQKFNSLAKKKSPLSAGVLLAAEAAKLKKLEEAIDEPYLSATYTEVLEHARAVTLAMSILGHPKRCHELIKSFGEAKIGLVDLQDLRKESTRIVETLLKRATASELIEKVHGWPLLSEMIGGLNSKRLIVISAKTGIGKTTIALNLALAIAKKYSILFFNMEMDIEDITQRLMQGDQNFNLREMVTYRKITEASNLAVAFVEGMIHRQAFLVSDGRALSLQQLISTIRKCVDEDKVKYVFIDYDQKIQSEMQGEEWKTLQKSVEALEEVAKEKNICVILLCQADDLGDPKASRRIKQSAAAVLHFYQDENTEEYFLEAIKNRFGAFGARLLLKYEPKNNLISEDRYADRRIQKTSVFKKR